MRVIFLDIDGVLNAHDYDPIAESSRIDPRAVGLLNRVLDACDPKIVVTSAWRYLVHEGAMTVRGFEHLLQSHHVHAKGRVLGVTRKDMVSGRHADARSEAAHLSREDLDALCREQRVRQIGDWIFEHNRGASEREHTVRRFAIVDDLDLPFYASDFATPGKFVRTDGRVGLQTRDADSLIGFFAGGAS